MSNFFKEMIRTSPHTLDEIRASLHQGLADHKQLLPLLKEHHNYIEESISYILDKDSTDFQKQEHLERFFTLIEMHAKSEEETLYKFLRQNSSIDGRIKGISGKDEHDIIFQLEKELNQMNYKKLWTEKIEAKARVVALQIKNHIDEEEDHMFSQAIALMTQEESEAIRDTYIKSCIAYLERDDISHIGINERMTSHQNSFDGDSFH